MESRGREDKKVPSKTKKKERKAAATAKKGQQKEDGVSSASIDSFTKKKKFWGFRWPRHEYAEIERRQLTIKAKTASSGKAFERKKKREGGSRGRDRKTKKRNKSGSPPVG